MFISDFILSVALNQELTQEFPIAINRTLPIQLLRPDLVPKYVFIPDSSVYAYWQGWNKYMELQPTENP